MARTLAVTVGGKPQPIARAIRTLHPDRVVYLCSGGANGSAAAVTRPQAEVPAAAERPFDPGIDKVVELAHPDDLSGCYSAISAALSEELERDPNGELLMDYTAGTKTMAVAAAMAASDLRLTLSITTGVRSDLDPLRAGESTVLVDDASLWAERWLITSLGPLWERHAYAEAAHQLRQILAGAAISPRLSQTIQRTIALSDGFNEWDRFDHRAAHEALRAHRKDLASSWVFLRRILASRAALDGADPDDRVPRHGAEPVEDLLLNAERRAAGHRYDDAVGRLYRAFELMAQIRLREGWNVATGDLDLERLPLTVGARAEWRDRCEHHGRVLVGAVAAYDLLEALGDPLGSAFAARRRDLLAALETRNVSLFAHGMVPIDAANWQRVDGRLGAFLRDEIDRRNREAGLPPGAQLPVRPPKDDRMND